MGGNYLEITYITRNVLPSIPIYRNMQKGVELVLTLYLEGDSSYPYEILNRIVHFFDQLIITTTTPSS